MKASIIKIGNSKGIKLSNKILEQYQITDEVELTLEADSIIMRPVLSPRKDWDEVYKQMAARGDEALLVEDIFESE